MIACCWCKRACSVDDDTKVEPDQVVFCLYCNCMQLVVQLPALVCAWGVRVRALATRPLTIDELSEQLNDDDTMRILCEMEGGGHHA